MPEKLPAWQSALEAEFPEPSLRRIVLAAAATIAIGFGGFAGWALTAPLDSAVPANGTIVVESKRKTVSLLDSGILQELLVHEGERVAAGQPLMRLDDTQARAQLGQAMAQRWATLCKLARLQAEQRNEGGMVFPEDLVAASGKDPAVAALMENEQRLFQSRRQTLRGALAVQEQKVREMKEELAAFDAQTQSAQTQLRFVDDRLKGLLELLSKGFAPKSQVLELQSKQAELKGSLGELAAHKAQGRQNVAETELELSRIKDSWLADVGHDLQDAQAQLADVSERIRAADDVLKHKLVTAPEEGIVSDIKFFTAGSSIVAGQPILDIVPNDDRLLVEAEVQPNDIEHVHTGQAVNVRLISYKQHKVPVLTGHLTYVSADRQTDTHGNPVFIARAELDRGALDGLKGVKLYPGMPAEVLIIGGERTAIDYFISPITDSLRRSLREE